VSPRVRELKVSSKDSVPKNSEERLTEVFARLLVSVPGIQLPSSGQSHAQVNKVTTPVLKSTKRSTVLALVQLEVLPTMLQLKQMLLRRISLLSVVSPSTVLSTTTTSSSEVKSLEPRSEPSFFASPSSQLLATG